MVTLQPVITPADLEEGRPGQPLLPTLPAGWPSPAESYAEDSLDLHRLVVRNPAATFFLRVTGDSMIEAGIHDGDLLVVDRSLPPTSKRVVVAKVDGELTVKRLIINGKRTFLRPENPSYPEIDLHEQEESIIWGVVTHVLHRL